MTRLELLKEIYEQISYNIGCYSKNWFCEKPKKGCEKKWQNEKDKATIIEKMIEEEVEKEKKRNIENTCNEEIEELE